MASVRTSVYSLAMLGASFATLAFGGLGATAAHAQAQIAVDLDQLSDAGQSSAMALDLASRQQAAGNLTGAASTLERALITNADADDVRLSYAAVLCRLDDHQSARQELRQLGGQAGNNALWRAVKATCGAGIVAQSMPARFSGELSAGLAYDGDAYGMLELERLGFPEKGPGLAAQTALHLAGAVPLEVGEIYASAGIDSRNDLSGPSDDYQMADVALGYGGRSGLIEYGVGGVFRKTWITGTSYANEYGGQARLAAPVGDVGRLVATAEIVRQEFNADHFNGEHYDLALNYEARPSNSFQYVLGAGVEYHPAPDRGSAYTAGRIVAGFSQVLAKCGTYIDGSTIVRFVDYGKLGTLIHRRDLRLFNRLALGTPLSVVPGLNVEAAVSYSYRNYDHSVLLHDYNSLGGELRLVWKFGRRG